MYIYLHIISKGLHYICELAIQSTAKLIGDIQMSTSVDNSRIKKSEKINKRFSDIIYSAELENQKIADYLDENPSALREWLSLEKKCKDLGVNPIILACKKLSKEQLLERI